jgi:alpha-ketoglutaric semialdehyde dehydrogenase
MTPALFAGTAEMRIAREELFGPVAVVIAADNYAHALHLANDTPCALCAGICTASLKEARHFRRNGQGRAVTVNLPTTAVEHQMNVAAAHFFTRTRIAYVAG